VYLTDLNSRVDLLIGANVPEALQLREIIPAADGGHMQPELTSAGSLMVQLGESRSMYLALVSSSHLRRLISCVQLVLILWMHLTPMV